MARILTAGKTKSNSWWEESSLLCLASQDALEVMESVSHSVYVSTDLTDVTLVSDDTYWRLDWCDSEDDEEDEVDEDEYV